MKVTFLIGNGFDIGIGLKTKYSDFLHEYSSNSDDSETIAKFKEIIAQETDAWSYAEKQFGIYTDAFAEDEIEQFLVCYQDFENHLHSYLEKEETRADIESHNIELQRVFLKALSGQYSTLQERSRNTLNKIYNDRKNEEQMITFVSFNYTDVFDRCIESLLSDDGSYFNFGDQADQKKQLSKVIHVHGSLDRYPLMGVNDISQIANKAFAANEQLCRMLIKPQANSEIGDLNDEKAAAAIDESDIIYIFGMSLGETDQTWWQSVKQWLSDYPDRQLIVYWRDIEHSTANKGTLFGIRNNVFSRLGFAQNDKDRWGHPFSNRLHIAINEPVFSIDLT